MTTIETAKPARKRQRRMAREPEACSTATPAKRTGNTDLVLRLLHGADGATIGELAEATGWLPHTARAALTGLKKKGHFLTSEKLEGRGRVYRIAVG